MFSTPINDSFRLHYQKLLIIFIHTLVWHGVTWSPASVMSAGTGEPWLGADVIAGTERLLGNICLDAPSEVACGPAAAAAASVTSEREPPVFPVTSRSNTPILFVSPAGSLEPSTVLVTPLRLPSFPASEGVVWSAALSSWVTSSTSSPNGLGAATLGLYHDVCRLETDLDRGVGTGAGAGGSCVQGPGWTMASHGWLVFTFGLVLQGKRWRHFKRWLQKWGRNLSLLPINKSF